MSLPDDEDDKPTVVLDLNALKKLKKEKFLEELSQDQEIQFSAHLEDNKKIECNEITEVLFEKESIKIILFDFQSDLFENQISQFPEGYEYVMVKDLQELNKNLKSTNFQILVFNYDANSRAVNQLCAQIKQKIPTTKTLIVAKNISPEKARAHSKTAYGASAYYQLPLDKEKLKLKFEKIYEKQKKAG